MSDDPQRFWIRTEVVLVRALGSLCFSAARDAVTRTFCSMSRNRRVPPNRAASNCAPCRMMTAPDGGLR
jgi:hypothetical protein